MYPKNPKSPCTRDCPNRTATCKVDGTCEKYAGYEDAKKDYYEARQRQLEADNALHDSYNRSLTPSRMRNYYAKKGGKK